MFVNVCAGGAGCAPRQHGRPAVLQRRGRSHDHPGQVGIQTGIHTGQEGVQAGVQTGQVGIQTGVQTGQEGVQAGVQTGQEGVQAGVQTGQVGVKLKFQVLFYLSHIIILGIIIMAYVTVSAFNYTIKKSVK